MNSTPLHSTLSQSFYTLKKKHRLDQSSNIMTRARRHWLGAVRRTFAKSSCRTVHAIATTATKRIDNNSVEDSAATKIQSYFRGHLARRAFRALRSLVKLQAAARGMFVRNQMRVAVRFMQATVRLQVRVRARQSYSANSADYVMQ